MDFSILQVTKGVTYDNSIKRIETIAHQPYESPTYNKNDEIHIRIENSDSILLPCQSKLHLEGKVTKADGTPISADTKIVRNGLMFLFDEIRLIMNGREIDKCRNVGMTSTMKMYASVSPAENDMLQNAGVEGTFFNRDKGTFEIYMPLRYLLGFCEDYNKVIIKSKLELILTRSGDDRNATVGTDTVDITLTKIQWLMPYVHPSAEEMVKLYDTIRSERPIKMAFRSWELHTYPMLPITDKQLWTIKTSGQFDKPRFVLVGFQTDRRNKHDKNAAQFDHCDLTNIKLYLNHETFPNRILDQSFADDKYALFYDMIVEFQRAYYNKNRYEPLLSRETFKQHAPLFAIDCSKTDESIKNGGVDVKLELESSQNFPAHTAAYCLIMQDKMFEYVPLRDTVENVS